MAKAAAGMHADRQPVLHGGLVDRPEVAAAQRHLAHDEHQDLHETAIAGATLDLLHRMRRVLERDHDRGPQALVAVEQLARDPLVDRRAERRAHVFAVQQLAQHVANGQPRAEVVERLAWRSAKSLPGRPFGGRQSGRTAAGALKG